MIRDDLQKINNVQNVYVATFALKIFRMIMIFVVDSSAKPETGKIPFWLMRLALTDEADTG